MQASIGVLTMTKYSAQLFFLGVLGTAPFLLGGVGRAYAELIIITTDDGSGADSRVRGGNPTTNYGTSDLVMAKCADWPQLHRKAYIRFDLSALGELKALDATLTLVALEEINGAATFNVFGLNDGATGEDWGETTITWDNAPANDHTSGSGVTSDATLLGQFTVPDVSGPVSITFSNPSLASFLNKDTDDLATLIITRATGGNSLNTGCFVAREHATLAPPTLEIVIPEPSTLALLGLLGLAVFGRRRRQLDRQSWPAPRR